MTVGERIKSARESKGLSQEELAKRMGYAGKSSVCKAETWGDNITTTKVVKFANALGVSFEYLMGWEMDIEKQGANPERLITYGAKLGELAKNNELMMYANKISELPLDKQKQIYAYIDFIASQTL